MAVANRIIDSSGVAVAHEDVGCLAVRQEMFCLEVSDWNVEVDILSRCPFSHDVGHSVIWCIVNNEIVLAGSTIRYESGMLTVCGSTQWECNDDVGVGWEVEVRIVEVVRCAVMSKWFVWNRVGRLGCRDIVS